MKAWTGLGWVFGIVELRFHFTPTSQIYIRDIEYPPGFRASVRGPDGARNSLVSEVPAVSEVLRNFRDFGCSRTRKVPRFWRFLRAVEKARSSCVPMLGKWSCRNEAKSSG